MTSVRRNFGSSFVPESGVTMAATTKQTFKWALEKFREGSKKSAKGKILFEQFHTHYTQDEEAAMEAMLDRYGVKKGTRLQKSDWDDMDIGEQAGGSDPDKSMAVTTLKSPDDEARYWRERYFELQTDYQQKQKEWAAEDKETAVAEAMLRKELEMKNHVIKAAQQTIKELMEERVNWAAAVGRRDGNLEAKTAHLDELKKQKREAAEARQSYWAKRKWNEHSGCKRWRWSNDDTAES